MHGPRVKKYRYSESKTWHTVANAIKKHKQQLQLLIKDEPYFRSKEKDEPYWAEQQTREEHGTQATLYY